jgi:hypothetical protein
MRAVNHSYDGIVAGASDGPVVQNEDIGHVLQTSEGFVVVDCNRLARKISARGDKGKWMMRHQQMVHGRTR